MKIRIFLLVVALAALPFVSSAEPFSHKRIPSDTRWMVHLDIESLVKTRVGDFISQALQRDFKEEIEEFQAQFGKNLSLGMNSVRSITAFGSGYELTPDSGGVLVLNVDGKIKDVATGLLVQQALAGADDAKATVKEVPNDDFSLYSIQSEVFVSFDDQDVVFLSKSRKEMNEARAIWSGKKSGMDASSSFGNLSELRDGFFFLAVAEEFNQKLPLPPQANFLKLAESARVVMGESRKDLFAELKLKAQDDKSALQTQQILQGLLAIAPLLAADEPIVQNLVSGSSLTNEKQVISLRFNYPVDDALKKLKALDAEEDEEEKEPAKAQ